MWCVPRSVQVACVVLLAAAAAAGEQAPHSALRAVVVDTVPPGTREFGAEEGHGNGYLYLGYAAEDHCLLAPASLQTGVRVTGCGPAAAWKPYAQVGTMRYLVFGPCAPTARDVTLDLDDGAVACRGKSLWPQHVTGLQPWA